MSARRYGYRNAHAEAGSHEYCAPQIDGAYLVVASRLLIVAARSSGWLQSHGEKLSAKLEQLGLAPLQIGAILTAHDADCTLPSVIRNLWLIDVFPGTAQYLRNAWTSAPADAEQCRHMLEQDAQVFNFIQFSAAGFTIDSDLLNIKQIYTYETAEYLALASRLSDLRGALGAALTEIDPLAIAQLVYFTTPLECRTLHMHTKRLPGAAHFRWGDGELRPTKHLQFPHLRAEMSLRSAAALLDETFAQSVTKRLDQNRGRNLVALSGGFDSRLIASTLAHIGADVHAYSYGRGYHHEWRVAKRVAKSLGLHTTLIPYDTENYTRSISYHIRAMEGQCETHSTQICNLLQIDAPSGSTLFHGFLGDAVQGRHLSWAQDVDYRTLDTLAESMTSKRPKEFERLLVALGLSVHRDDIVQSLISSFPTQEHTYLSLIAWDWMNRQRRYVASHLAILGIKFRMAVPFYDRGLMSLWMSVPRIGLDDRYMLRQILRLYHPKVAQVRHAHEKEAIAPNVWTKLWLNVEGLPNHVLYRALGRSLPWRDSNIYRLSAGAVTKRQRQYQIGAIRASSHDLRAELSLDLDTNFLETFSGGGALTSPRLSVLRKLFGLSAYATWLAGGR